MESTSKFLSPIGMVSIPGWPGVLDPREVLGSHKGEDWSREFDELILSKAVPVSDFEGGSAIAFDVAAPASDIDIRSELPERHVYEDEKMFCVHLAVLIGEQANGEEGALLADGGLTFFYVSVSGNVLAIRVGWNTETSEWFYVVSSRDDIKHMGNLRVLAPAD